MSEALLRMGEEVFALHLLFWRSRISKSNITELSETQFLTLDILNKNGLQNVGDLQRAIGVLPAQMSRVIRALESNFDSPLIHCELNAHDKRKIDVTITEAGTKAYEDFKQAKITNLSTLIGTLNPSDQENLVRICREMIKNLREMNAANLNSH